MSVLPSLGSRVNPGEYPYIGVCLRRRLEDLTLRLVRHDAEGVADDCGRRVGAPKSSFPNDGRRGECRMGAWAWRKHTTRALDPYVLRASPKGIPDPVNGKGRLAASNSRPAAKARRERHLTSPRSRRPGWELTPDYRAASPSRPLLHSASKLSGRTDPRMDRVLAQGLLAAPDSCNKAAPAHRSRPRICWRSWGNPRWSTTRWCSRWAIPLCGCSGAEAEPRGPKGETRRRRGEMAAAKHKHGEGHK
jgi:hypothetical protein